MLKTLCFNNFRVSSFLEIFNLLTGRAVEKGAPRTFDTVVGLYLYKFQHKIKTKILSLSF